MGAPGGAISYADFQAIRALGNIYGEVANAAALAIAAEIVGTGATLLGGFAAGYMIGEFILNKLAPDTLLPPMRDGVTGGSTGNDYILTIKSEDTLFGPLTFEKTVHGKFGAVIFQTADGIGYNYYVITEGGLVPLLNINRENIITAPYVFAARRADGAPEAFRSTPTWPGTLPTTYPTKRPTTIPIPGITPAFPITPTIYPDPGTTPDQDDNKKYAPGPLVRIPETGDNFQFTPSGVIITRSTPTSPYPQEQVKQNPIPPAVKPPKEECPCPEPDLTEVICRLKRLESDLLDDGYDYTVHNGTSGNSGTTSIDTDEPFAVIMTINSKPVNARTEPGGDSAPMVVFSGWFSETLRGKPGVRQPIHYEGQTFRLSKEAEGYSWTLYKGFTGSTQFVTRKKKDYADNC